MLQLATASLIDVGTPWSRTELQHRFAALLQSGAKLFGCRLASISSSVSTLHYKILEHKASKSAMSRSKDGKKRRQKLESQELESGWYSHLSQSHNLTDIHRHSHDIHRHTQTYTSISQNVHTHIHTYTDVHGPTDILRHVQTYLDILSHTSTYIAIY